MFQFHLKWTVVLSTGRRVLVETKILETWNIGKLGERIINDLSTEERLEFEISEVKKEAAILENDETVHQISSDESGPQSGSSVTPETSTDNDKSREMNNMIEPGKEKYVFNGKLSIL